MFFAERFAPAARSRIRDERVSGHVGEDFGELDPLHHRQEQGEYFRAADNGHRVIAGNFQRLVRVMGGFSTDCIPIAILGQDDVTAPRKQTGQAFECFPTHDHCSPGGQNFEPFEIGREVPRQPTLPADYAIGGPCNDDGVWSLVHPLHLQLSRAPAKGAIATQ